MKILVVTNDWSPVEGGIATLTEGLSRALAGRDHEVTVLAPKIGAGMRATDSPGLRVLRWRGYDLGWLRWFPHAWATLASWHRGDVVLSMNPAYAGLALALLSPFRKKRYIAWAYGYELLRAKGTILGAIYRFTFSRAHRVVAISSWTRDALLDLGVTKERITLIPPGVEPLPARSDSDDARLERHDLPSGPIILSVGRLIERKGHRRLIEAMPTVVRQHPDATLVIVGRGPEHVSLERRIKTEAMESSVRLLGYVTPDQLLQLYDRARLFALTPTASGSDAEGYGIVFLEAGRHGLAVVAGRSGGVSDAVIDDETGRLVDPEDVPAIADAMSELLSDPKLATRLGEAGRRRAASQSWDAVAEAVERAVAQPGP